MERLIENILKEAPLTKPFIMDLLNKNSDISFNEDIDNINNVLKENNIKKESFIKKNLYFFLIASIIKEDIHFFNEFINDIDDVFDFIDTFDIRCLPYEEMNECLYELINEKIYEYQDIPKRFEYYTGHVESHYGEDMLLGSKVQFIDDELINEIIDKVLKENKVTKKLLLKNPDYLPEELTAFNCYIKDGEVVVGDYENDNKDDEIFNLVAKYYDLKYFRADFDPREGFFYIERK